MKHEANKSVPIKKKQKIECQTYLNFYTRHRSLGIRDDDDDDDYELKRSKSLHGVGWRVAEEIGKNEMERQTHKQRGDNQPTHIHANRS